MVSCRECFRLVSRRCNGGVHRTCAADRLAARPQPLSLPGACLDTDLDAVLGSLPSLDDIFSAAIGTRDLISSALLPSGQKEFLRCIVQVLQHNTADAWADPGGLPTRCRASGVLWLGLSSLYFARLAWLCCLVVLLSVAATTTSAPTALNGGLLESAGACGTRLLSAVARRSNKQPALSRCSTRAEACQARSALLAPQSQPALWPPSAPCKFPARPAH